MTVNGAAVELPVEITEDSKSRRIEVHHEPLGVIAAIVPWNFPGKDDAFGNHGFPPERPAAAIGAAPYRRPLPARTGPTTLDSDFALVQAAPKWRVNTVARGRHLADDRRFLELHDFPLKPSRSNVLRYLTLLV
jgi:hypothetical protein